MGFSARERLLLVCAGVFFVLLVFGRVGDLHSPPALGVASQLGNATDEPEAEAAAAPMAGEEAGACFRLPDITWRPARCPPNSHWLPAWMKARVDAARAANSSGGVEEAARSWTLVDVGANKGYTLTGWAEQLLGSANTPFTARNLGISLYNKTRNFHDMSLCGACCDCGDAPVVIDATNVGALHLKAIAFEPGPSTARHLAQFFRDRKMFDIRHKAVAQKGGRAFFPDVKLGNETGRLQHKLAPPAGRGDSESVIATAPTGRRAPPRMVPVDVVALDDELAPLYASPSAPGIDILLTDVEGLDGDVARGARRLLASGMVSAYIFEMHGRENYTEVFHWLDRVAGFECYFGTEQRKSGRSDRVPRFVRITGPCWRDEYETYSGWMNAICAHRARAPELVRVAGALTRKMMPASTTCTARWRLQLRTSERFIHRYLPREHADFMRSLR
jgi:FkbM family methyltransferase